MPFTSTRPPDYVSPLSHVRVSAPSPTPGFWARSKVTPCAFCRLPGTGPATQRRQPLPGVMSLLKALSPLDTGSGRRFPLDLPHRTQMLSASSGHRVTGLGGGQLRLRSSGRQIAHPGDQLAILDVPFTWIYPLNRQVVPQLQQSLVDRSMV